MKPRTLTTGTATSVPYRSLGLRVARSRRTTSTPITSSPWMAALTQIVGPSCFPCTIWTGRLTSPPVTRRVIGSSTSLREPGRTRTCPIANDSRAMLAPVPVAGLLVRTASAVRPRRVDEEPAAQGLAADEHPETHRIPVGEGDLGGHHLVEDPDVEQDDEAFLGMARGAAYVSDVVDRSLDDGGVQRTALPGVHAEAHPRLAVSLERLDAEGMKCRRTGTGIYLRLHPRNRNLRESNPLTPPHHLSGGGG